MQISRRILLACVATAIFLPSFSKAQDTEAQKKAREALEQKLRELGAQPAQPAQPVQPAQPAQPAKPAQQVQPTQPAQPVQPAQPAQPVPQARPAEPAPARPPAQATPPASANRPQVAPAKEQGNVFFEAIPENTTRRDTTAAERALQEKMQQMNREAALAQPEPASPAKQTQVEQPESEPKQKVEKPAKPEKVKTAQKSKEPEVLRPLQGPPTGLSPEKEQKLADLLEEYRADKLTPAEYHAQRAKILAEP